VSAWGSLIRYLTLLPSFRVIERTPSPFRLLFPRFEAWQFESRRGFCSPYTLQPDKGTDYGDQQQPSILADPCLPFYSLLLCKSKKRR
jgi:hypothetical protein